MTEYVEKKYKVLIIVIAVTSILNFIFNGWLFYQIKKNSSRLQSAESSVLQESEQPPLPEELHQQKQTLFSDFQKNFNSENFQKIYNLFGVAAQKQISLDDIKNEISRLRKSIGDIKSGFFSHYEYKEDENNLKAYILYYQIKVSNKNFSDGQGILRISLLGDGTQFELIGIRIHSL